MQCTLSSWTWQQLCRFLVIWLTAKMGPYIVVGGATVDICVVITVDVTS